MAPFTMIYHKRIARDLLPLLSSQGCKIRKSRTKEDRALSPLKIFSPTESKGMKAQVVLFKEIKPRSRCFLAVCCLQLNQRVHVVFVAYQFSAL